MSRGHVFITMGDITHMEVDAWLLPTDRELSFKTEWRGEIPDLDARVAASDTDPLGAEESHAAWLAGVGGEPGVVLATVPFEGVRDQAGIEHIATSVREFVSVATARVSDARHRRSKRLLAASAFGTRGGGGAKLRGQLAERLLDVCAEGRALMHRLVASPGMPALVGEWSRDAGVAQTQDAAREVRVSGGRRRSTAVERWSPRVSRYCGRRGWCGGEAR